MYPKIPKLPYPKNPIVDSDYQPRNNLFGRVGKPFFEPTSKAPVDKGFYDITFHQLRQMDGADTKRYLSAVDLVEPTPGSEILCAQPKFRFSLELDPSVGAMIVESMPYLNVLGSQMYTLISPESKNLVLPSCPIALV